jgi:tetraacyldisaccharide 4'-kinase
VSPGRRREDFLWSIWNGRGALSTLLLPFAWLYGAFSQRRMRAQARQAWRAPVPVIVIGNILVGGTGKTPVAAAVCQFLQAHGWRPGLISRGYGVRIGTEPHLSDDSAEAAHLGDEPALLHAATHAPVAAHPRRSLAARRLLDVHPEIDVLIADDGLQHQALARDLEILVQDGRGTGNGRLLPAGPLREPPARLAHADWVVTQLAAGESPLPGPDSPPRRVLMRLRPADCTQLRSGDTLEWSEWHARYATAPCSAAAGIGRPERFFAMLRDAGVTLAQTRRLPDHGTLTAALLATLPEAPVLITAKDAVKCPQPADPRLWAVEAQPRFDPPEWLADLEHELRRQARPQPHNRGDRH